MCDIRDILRQRMEGLHDRKVVIRLSACLDKVIIKSIIVNFINHNLSRIRHDHIKSSGMVLMRMTDDPRTDMISMCRDHIPHRIGISSPSPVKNQKRRLIFNRIKTSMLPGRICILRHQIICGQVIRLSEGITLYSGSERARKQG